jgi:hypothetical protein
VLASLTTVDTGAHSPNVAERLAESDPAGLLYGAIVTAAVLVTSGGHEDSSKRVLATWAIVLSVYWLTHVYVHAAKSQFQGDTHHLFSRSALAAKAELPVLAGGIPAMAVFIVVASTDTDVFDASRAALYFTVALLAAFGYVGTRHSGRSVAAALGEAFGASLLGLLMVLAKTLLH